MVKGGKLGSIIKELRAAKDLSQFDLAVKSGLGLSTLQKMEQGKIVDSQVRLETLQKLAAALNMKPSEIVRLIDK